MCEKEGEKLTKRLLKHEDEIEYLKDDLKIWTDALEELSEIEDAFKTNEKPDIQGRTILDVGTDAVKPLYIALKFNPSKIVGITESFRSFEADLEQKSKLFAQAEIGLYACSFFDDETLDRIKKKESMSKKRFDFVLISKTLHHLRDGKCVAKERDKKHVCREDKEYCIYGFEEQAIFEKLFALGKRVVIYEYFDPSDEDNDKIRGRGGYFTVNEWLRILRHLSEKYEVKFVRPKNFQLHIGDLENDFQLLRQVDCICFYVEEEKPNSV